MKSLITLIRAFSALSLAAILPATALTVGSKGPEFELTDTSGATHKLSDFSGKVVVLEWVNHGCPFVRKHYDSGNMQSTQRAATSEGVVWLSICSSGEGEQGNHTPAQWKKLNEENNTAATAVLLDASGKVGRLYGARTTPHMFVIDASGTLVYQGGIDSIASTSKADLKRAENHVLAALADINAGRPVAKSDTRPYGCSIKYVD
jgi:hypothetical protein